jgi:DNA polymerase I-like protein with 3'-5' exonuclease and polymerase domains
MQPTVNDLTEIFTPGELYAIDLETTGLDPLDESVVVLGVGISCRDGVYYINLVESSDTFRRILWDMISKVELVAHNMMFDLGFIQRDAGCTVQPIGCTLVLFKMLAAEGWTGQRWGLDVAIEDILGWPDSNKDALKEMLDEHGLSKSEMWRLSELEPNRFGHYCALDAEACWQLWSYMTQVCQDEYPSVLVWHQQEFMTQIKLLAEQQVRGIQMNVEELEKYRDTLASQMVQVLEDFRALEVVQAYEEELSTRALFEHSQKRPPQHTKAGKESKRYEAWRQKMFTIHDTHHFNPQSKQQLAHLFYDRIYTTTEVEGRLHIYTREGKKLGEAELTPTGRPAVQKKLLPMLGAPGQLLAKYNKLAKEQGYVSKCLEMLDSDGVLHPQFRVHGTVTGRLGGSGGFNLQQQPKSRGYMECFAARPGYKLVQLDFSAVEPVVLTNACKDPTLMALYGPDAKPNDVYLFVAAHIGAFKDKILQYYDPYEPTAEGIADAKKYCKAERQLTKTVHLAKQYGAGAPKLFHTFREAGHPLEFEEVREICADWDKLFIGTKQFAKKLEQEWYSRGYIQNLLYRPLAVDADKTKDLVNRFCQSSGHDLLLKFLCHVDVLRTMMATPMKPWILDFHDETIWEVPEERAQEAADVLQMALGQLNKELADFIDIPIKGDVEIVETLAGVKCD